MNTLRSIHSIITEDNPFDSFKITNPILVNLTGELESVWFNSTDGLVEKWYKSFWVYKISILPDYSAKIEIERDLK